MLEKARVSDYKRGAANFIIFYQLAAAVSAWQASSLSLAAAAAAAGSRPGPSPPDARAQQMRGGAGAGADLLEAPASSARQPAHKRASLAIGGLRPSLGEAAAGDAIQFEDFREEMLFLQSLGAPAVWRTSQFLS
jgi:hypothetical protein